MLHTKDGRAVFFTWELIDSPAKGVLGSDALHPGSEAGFLSLLGGFQVRPLGL
jgi:hypothetical protein